jgi:hypothetical protein
MKSQLPFILTALAWAFVGGSASAHLWESQGQIELRYGAPVKATGYPNDRSFRYAYENFEIEIKFSDGVSDDETYSHSDRNRPLTDSDIQRILGNNSAGSQWLKEKENDWTVDSPKGRAHADFFPDSKPQELHLYTADSVKRMIEVPPVTPVRTLKDQSLHGVVTLRKDEAVTTLVVRSGDLVLQVPWSAEGYPEKGRPRSGETCTLTLRDEDNIDTGEVVAFVSDREHKSFEDLVSDSRTYLVQRLEQNHNVLFDRSVCEVHHVKMSQKIADVAYGLWAPSSSDEALCAKNFPHYRDFILGGCVSSDTSPKKAPLYVCPKCVEACKRLKL